MSGFLKSVFPGFSKSEIDNKTLVYTVTGIATDQAIKRRAAQYDLDVLPVSWDDTGRDEGSCWGKNNSDVTLKPMKPEGGRCPIIRRPNFADLSCDVAPDSWNLTVQSRDGGEATRVTPQEYLTSHIIGKDGKAMNLWCDRDAKGFLTSAQANILPLSDGACEFVPTLFNYQSARGSGDPALLVVVSTNLGTTAIVITERTINLYYELKGKAANYVATRLRDDREKRGVPLDGPMTQEERDRNVLLILSVPLKQKMLSRGGGFGMISLKGGPVVAGGGLKYWAAQKHGGSFDTQSWTPYGAGITSFGGGPYGSAQQEDVLISTTSLKSYGGSFGASSNSFAPDCSPQLQSGTFSFGAKSSAGEFSGKSYSAAPPSAASASFGGKQGPWGEELSSNSGVVLPDEDGAEDLTDMECKLQNLENASISFHSNKRGETKKRGIDHAMLGIGEPHSAYPARNLPSAWSDLVRDTTLPIRATMQLYRVTDVGDIPEGIFSDIDTAIKKIYAKGSAQGSLVVPMEGDAPRPTAPTTGSMMGALLD